MQIDDLEHEAYELQQLLDDKKEQEKAMLEVQIQFCFCCYPRIIMYFNI